ncbi:hypothetical protein F5148DRAFT_1233544 [Russula earlei]|uniref:Uncharacterized protein n=1 Tax=Russula earlei TaxID=71964 RepID=A0ACC0TY28_9AGAM|nr:hypothetical protein F5148DRAFT_1233544 [Russula earlei]
MYRGVLRCWLRGERVCVLDVPLLIETKLSAEIQLLRLMQRDGLTRDNARARLQAQLPITEKLDYADVVLDNSGTQAELEVHVDEIARRWCLEAGWSWRLKWLIPPVGLFAAIWTLIVMRARRSRRKAEGGPSR